MSGLYVVGGVTFNSLATGAILVVAIAVLGSITVLPALLVKLGRWVDRPRVPLPVATQPPDRPLACADQQPAARPGRAPPGRSRSPCRASSILGARRPGAGHEDPLRPRSTRCPSSIPAGADRQATSARAFPADEGASARRGRPRPTARHRTRSRPPWTDLTDEAVATGDFVASGRGVQTSRGRLDHRWSCSACRTTRPTRGSTTRSWSCRGRPGAGGARRRWRRVRRRRRRRASAWTSRQQQDGRLALVIGFVAAADDDDHGSDVPQRPARGRSRRCSTWPRSARRSV